MKYDCLILDHDDTCVDSTASIHYPAHVEVMKRLRPDQDVIDLHGWFEKNFHPGIMEFLTGELGMSDQELALEYDIWQEYNRNRNPSFFPGLPDLLKDYVSRGGLIAVVSHSVEEHIQRHWDRGADGVMPSRIFGWHQDQEKRKPSPYPVERILDEFNLSTDRVLVIDDLKPGVDMAKAAGVAVAAAGWGHQVPVVQEQMKALCDFYLPDIEALKTLVLD